MAGAMGMRWFEDLTGFRDQSRFIQSSLIQTFRTRERLPEPKGADVERPLDAFKPVARFFHVVAINQTVGNQPTLLGWSIDRIERPQHSGVRGGRKNTNGIIRFEASSDSLP
jgi:hypothetical protein